MIEVKADKAYSKEFDGKHGKWMKYSIKSGDNPRSWRFMEAVTLSSLSAPLLLTGQNRLILQRAQVMKSAWAFMETKKEPAWN